MKSFLLMTGSGPLVILTSCEFMEDTALLAKLQRKGIDKFIAYELPLELARERYGGHYAAVMNDWLETDDLRVWARNPMAWVTPVTNLIDALGPGEVARTSVTHSRINMAYNPGSS